MDAATLAVAKAYANKRLNWRGAWAATTAYAVNDLVTYNGGLYRAPTAFTSGASFVKANWVELVQQSGTSVPVRRDSYGALDGPQTVDRSGTTATDTALQAGLNAVGAIVEAHRLDTRDGATQLPITQTFDIPDGTYLLNSGLTIPQGVSVRMAPGAVLKANGSIAGAMLATNLTELAQDVTIQGGVLDCNGQARNGLYLPLFAHVDLTDMKVYNATQHGVILGDTGASTSSYEAMLRNLRLWRPKGVSVPAGYYGVWFQNAGDCKWTQGIVNGWDTCVRNDKGDNRFAQVHGWNYNGDGPSVVFDDNSSQATYTDCYADSPTLYGWWLRQSGIRLVGCGAFMNGFTGTDNVAMGVRIEGSGLSMFLAGLRIFGNDGTHRFAKDIDGDITGTTIIGLQTNNVVTTTFPNHVVQVPNKVGLAVRNGTGTSALIAGVQSGGSFHSQLSTSGVWTVNGLTRTLVTKTANYTLTSTDSVILSNGTTLTHTLPSPSSIAGREYKVRNIHASSACTVGATSGNVDGGASVSIAAGSAKTFVSDGSAWWTV